MAKKINAENNPRQKEHFGIVGERLRELRIMEGLSIKGIEEINELPSGTIHNIEHGRGGTGTSLLALITFFSEKGYNIKWILDYDNSTSFKKEEEMIFMDINKAELVEISEELGEVYTKMKKTVKKYL